MHMKQFIQLKSYSELGRAGQPGSRFSFSIVAQIFDIFAAFRMVLGPLSFLSFGYLWVFIFEWSGRDVTLDHLHPLSRSRMHPPIDTMTCYLTKRRSNFTFTFKPLSLWFSNFDDIFLCKLWTFIFIIRMAL